MRRASDERWTDTRERPSRAFRAFVSLSALALSWLSAGGARAEVVTLAEAEERALRSRPTVDAVRARVRQARAEIDRVESARRPSFTFDAGTQLHPSGELIRVEDVTGETFWVQGTREFGESRAFLPVPRYEAVFSFRSNLFDFGRTRAAMRAARAGRRAAQVDEEAAVIELRSAVRASYLVWYQAHAQHALFVDLHQDAERRRARVEERIALGARPPAERTLALHGELTAALDLRRSEQQLESARLALEHAIGERLPVDAEPDPRVVDVELPARPIPDLRSAAFDQRAAAASASAAFQRRQRLPVLIVAAQTGIRGQLDRIFPNYRLSVTFSVPLWDGGNVAADVDTAEAQAAEFSAQAEQLRRDYRRAIEQAQLDRRQAEAQLRVLSDLVEVSARRLEQAEEQYELGVGNLEAIADARVLLGRARAQAISARVAAAEAAFRLME